MTDSVSGRTRRSHQLGGTDAPFAKRRGRPILLPDDVSPMRAVSFDPAARTAWLAATCRSLSPDPAVAHRASFLERLRDADVAADPTRLSRWESGSQVMPARALAGYEGALGMPEGGLVAAQRGVLRSSDPAGPVPENLAYSHPGSPADKLAGALVEKAVDPSTTMGGGDWLRLAVELTRFDMVLLTRATWDAVCDRLLCELARTSGTDRLRRYEAAVTLICHPLAQRHVMRALGAWLIDPDVQVVFPMMSLLQHVRHERASKLVLRLLDSDISPISHGAVKVAAAKTARGHFEGAPLALLEQRATRELITPYGQRGTDVLDLLAQLPLVSYQKVVATVRDPQVRSRVKQARETGALVPLDVARSLSRNIATRAQAETPTHYAAEPDLLLQRLVREALFHVHSPRRSIATDLLGLSPYGPAIADGCLALALGDNEFIGARAWEAMWVLGTGHRRHDVVSVATTGQSTWRRRRALTALGTAGESLDDAEADRVAQIATGTAHQGVRSAALLALGMGAPARLTGLEPLGPRDKAAARWWHRVGPALRDPDSDRP